MHVCTSVASKESELKYIILTTYEVGSKLLSLYRLVYRIYRTCSIAQNTTFDAFV